MCDSVNHPSHYTQGGIECIEAIEAMTGEGFPDYCRGNILKYLWRYKDKNGTEDLKKARWYLGAMIANLERESNDDPLKTSFFDGLACGIDQVRDAYGLAPIVHEKEIHENREETND